MKIITVGRVILTPDDIKVQGWNVQRESTDPPLEEATDGQLLLEVAIPWAQKKMNEAIMQNLQRISREIKAAQNPTTITGEN